MAAPAEARPFGADGLSWPGRGFPLSVIFNRGFIDRPKYRHKLHSNQNQINASPRSLKRNNCCHDTDARRMASTWAIFHRDRSATRYDTHRSRVFRRGSVRASSGPILGVALGRNGRRFLRAISPTNPKPIGTHVVGSGIAGASESQLPAVRSPDR